MEVKYDKTAVLEYIANFRNLQDLMRRDMDESLNKYNACKQEYSRIFTECEEESHRAYNRVMSAESEIQMADMMMEQAMASVSDSDSDDEGSQPDYDMINRAQEMRRQAEADLVVAQADYSRAQDNISKLNAVMEKYGPSLEAESKVVNDTFTECSIVGSKAGEALEQYVGVMDKAYSALYESSAPQGSMNGSGSSSSSGSSGSSTTGGTNSGIGGNATVSTGDVGVTSGINAENSTGDLNAGQGADKGVLGGISEQASAQTGVSNSMNGVGKFAAEAVTIGIVSFMIAGQRRNFSNSKAGLNQAYKTAIKANDKSAASEILQAFNSFNSSSTANMHEDVQDGGSNKSIISKFFHRDSEADKRWNEEYFPLVEANIRTSVNRMFSGYVSPEKVDESIEKLSFMGQSDLKKKYGEGFQQGTLGFNDGETSNIAHDIKQPSLDGRVGTQNLQGSGKTNINYAFVTAVHENLHMMSANDTPACRKRGLMVGNDEISRAMNEAFTEYFTYLSCGGDLPSGGLYPGVYSGYHSIMQEMPTLEEAVGRDCMLEAYFHNNPNVLREKVDSLLEEGAWDNMCAGAYALLYSPSMIDNQPRLSYYFDRLSAVSNAYYADLDDKIRRADANSAILDWRGEKGNSLRVPKDKTGQLFKELQDLGVEGIPYDNGNVDFSRVSKFNVEFSDVEKLYLDLGTTITFGDLTTEDSMKTRKQFGSIIRNRWQSMAKEQLLNKIETDVQFAEEFSNKTGVNVEAVKQVGTLTKLQDELRRVELTLHESTDCKQIQLVPTKIHHTFKHVGGTAEMLERLLNGNLHSKVSK